MSKLKLILKGNPDGLWETVKFRLPEKQEFELVIPHSEPGMIRFIVYQPGSAPLYMVSRKRVNDRYYWSELQFPVLDDSVEPWTIIYLTVLRAAPSQMELEIIAPRWIEIYREDPLKCRTFLPPPVD